VPVGEELVEQLHGGEVCRPFEQALGGGEDGRVEGVAADRLAVSVGMGEQGGM